MYRRVKLGLTDAFKNPGGNAFISNFKAYETVSHLQVVTEKPPGSPGFFQDRV